MNNLLKIGLPVAALGLGALTLEGCGHVDVTAERGENAVRAKELYEDGFVDITTPSGKARATVDECTDREKNAIEQALQLGREMGFVATDSEQEFRCAREAVGTAGKPVLGYTDIGTPESSWWKFWEEPEAPGDAAVVAPAFFREDPCEQAAGAFILTECARGINATCSTYTGKDTRPSGVVGLGAKDIKSECEDRR
ncbi:MAG: hypothetical protein WC777_02275 [Candidatus Gracilibacteria bacterium]|jgi:hypothetical protein